MDFKARVGKLGNRSRVAVAIGVVVVAASAWAVPTVTASTSIAADQGVAQGQDSGAQDGSQSSGSGSAAAAQQAGGVPEGIAHASEAGGNAVNITIDDGPDPVWTPKVLDVLKRSGVKATFCTIGPQAKTHPTW